MDWVERFNKAITYIEGHLHNEIDYAEIAQLACCSTYHFQRMFSYMAGVPLAEYIRRRRMTKAAFDLRNSEDKIIDVALRYGYDSPTAFNRAFQSVHGVAPSVARSGGAMLKAYSPISFKITIKGEEEMNYRIEEKAAFRIVGVKLETSWTDEKKEGFYEVPQFWAHHAQIGTMPKLINLMDAEPSGMLGVSVGDLRQSNQFDYYIAVSSTQRVPEGMCEYEVPACTWAVFECRGAMPAAIHKAQERIMTEWLPNSGYEYAKAPDIEVYTEGDQTSEDYLCWIWLPVRLK